MQKLTEKQIATLIDIANQMKAQASRLQDLYVDGASPEIEDDELEHTMSEAVAERTMEAWKLVGKLHGDIIAATQCAYVVLVELNPYPSSSHVPEAAVLTSVSPYLPRKIGECESPESGVDYVFQGSKDEPGVVLLKSPHREGEENVKLRVDGPEFREKDCCLAAAFSTVEGAVEWCRKVGIDGNRLIRKEGYIDTQHVRHYWL